MHVYDSYHARWFILYSAVFLVTAISGFIHLPDLSENTLSAIPVLTAFLIIMVSGALISNSAGFLISLFGILTVAGARFVADGILQAVLFSAGYLILLGAAFRRNANTEPETGPVAQEWIAAGLLYGSLFIGDAGTRGFLLLSIGIRFLSGLVFRMVPVRTAVDSTRYYAHVFSWLPGMLVLSLNLFFDEMYLIRQGLLWLFFISRLYVLLDEARTRIQTLSALVPRGEQRGLWKSYAVYYLIPFRTFFMMRFYKNLVPPGGFAWDVGAHLGNRSRIWLNLGARVTAFEPQPSCAAILENWFGTSSNFSLVRAAVGSESGRVVLNLPEKNPTLASVSKDWVDRMEENPLFAGIKWNKTINVPMISLGDFRRDSHNPDFVKIDVEGFESQVLGGLGGTTPGCLSFEILPSDRMNALTSIEILSGKGHWSWNVVIKEQFRFRWNNPVSRKVLTDWIDSLDDEDPSGDIYAFRNSDD